jgi:hypothetical protein
MTPQIDNLDSIASGLIGRLHDAERRIDDLSSAQLGKVKHASTQQPAIHPATITPTTAQQTLQIPVPKFATSCGYLVYAYAGGHNTTAAADQLIISTQVDLGSYTRSRTTRYGADPGEYLTARQVGLVHTINFDAGAQPFVTVTASVATASGTWTDQPTNLLQAAGTFIFQY